MLCGKLQICDTVHVGSLIPFTVLLFHWVNFFTNSNKEFSPASPLILISSQMESQVHNMCTPL